MKFLNKKKKDLITDHCFNGAHGEGDLKSSIVFKEHPRVHLVMMSENGFIKKLK